MKEYRIKKVDANDIAAFDPLWAQAAVAQIDEFAWDDGTGYRPRTQAQLLHTESGIFVRFETDESPLRAECRQHNGRICEDSCMEFFFCPDNDDDRYLNFEMNSLGTLMVGLGKERANRTLLDFDVSLFRIIPQVENGIWTHRLFIPFSFILQHYQKISPVFYGNLYKCGDKTARPHYGSWNRIGTPQPDFHAPQYFGRLVLE